MQLDRFLSARCHVSGGDMAEARRRALENPEHSLEEQLLRMNAVAEVPLRQALSEFYRVEFLASIPDEYLDSSLISDIPVEWVRRHGILPVRRGTEIMAAVVDAGNLQAQEELNRILDSDIEPLVTTEKELRRAIDQCYFEREHRATTAPSESKQVQQYQPVMPEPPGGDDLLQGGANAPVAQLVNRMVLKAVSMRASDIHIEPRQGAVRIRFRIDGALYEQDPPPAQYQQALVSRLKVMAKLDIAEKRLPQDGMARVYVGTREIDIRISTIPVADGERLVLRLLDQHASLLTLEELGMPDDIRDALRRTLSMPYGAVWVTGPTGSGKTTSLYAALQEIDAGRRNVMTIEDPVEYQLSQISQMSVKPKIGLTFSQGLRHILRQDPDVILVGEIRDLETAEIAVRASLTGHLVFSTLHTNDAVGAVVRLMDIGVPAYLVAAATQAVLAQRLVRRCCPACARSVQWDATRHPLPDTYRNKLEGATIAEPVGCDQCVDGYAGRIGIYEWLHFDEAIVDLVRKGVDSSDLRSHIYSRHVRTMMDDGIAKVLSGITTIEEVCRATGTGLTV